MTHPLRVNLAEHTNARRSLCFALESAAKSLRDESLIRVAGELAEDLKLGKPLPESMRRYPDIFSKAHIHLIEAGVILDRIEK